MLKRTIRKRKNYSIVGFSRPRLYLVGFIDIVNSTGRSHNLQGKKFTRYYQLSLNAVSKIIEKYDGVVIKNLGDGLFFYFPRSNNNSLQVVMAGIECGLEIMNHRDSICDILLQEKLPPVDYRISLDFGKVFHMKTNRDRTIDLLGDVVNFCKKINSFAMNNGIVIGNVLRNMMGNNKIYEFQSAEFKTSNNDASTSVFLVTKRTEPLIM